MELTTDAMPSNKQINQYLDDKTLHKTIDENILLKIEENLEDYEKISILFLMYEEKNYCIKELLDTCDKLDFKGILCKFIPFINEWKEKFLESISIIGLKNIIVDLGLSVDDLEVRFSSNVTCLVTKINGGTKILYKLFESLDNEQSKLLCKLIYKNIPIKKFSQDDILEYHAFYWLQKKYIFIPSDGLCDLSKIYKHMKEIGLFGTPIYYDMEKYSNPHVTSEVEEAKLLDTQEETKEKEKKIITNAYVVIINEVDFPKVSKYETRYGSSIDANSLKKTFIGMNYTVVKHDNKTEKEIYEILDDLSNVVNSKHDCVIVCVLSHGFKGGFISHDAKEIYIDMIEKKMCCDSFRKKLKILIIQACQGENTGRALPGEDVVPDCGNKRHQKNGQAEYLIKYTEFFKFSATINDFVSMRDKRHGTWFIKAICDVLRNAKNKEISIEKWARQVNEHVQAQRGKLPNNDFDAAQVSQSENRLKNKYFFPFYRAHE